MKSLLLEKWNDWTSKEIMFTTTNRVVSYVVASWVISLLLFIIF